MKLRILPIAESEAKAAACWYDDRQADLGDEFLDDYAKRLSEIETKAERFSLLETNESLFEIRRAILRRFPYGIVFQVLDNEIVVLAVMHLSRRPNYWIRRMS